MTGRKKRAIRPVEERLRDKLEPGDNGCINFTGWRCPHGYGRLRGEDGRMGKPHRFAYELWVGPIPDGLFICHHCDNPSCCNPDHLFVGDANANSQDMIRKGRGNTTGLRAASWKIGPALRDRAEKLRAEAAIEAGYAKYFKRCNRCDQFKAPDEFGPNAGRSDGLQVYCIPCRHERTRQRRADDQRSLPA